MNRWYSMKTLATAAVAWLTGLAAATAEAQTTPRPVLIRNAVNQGVCLHKRSPDWQDGNIIHLWTCDGGIKANKAWIFELGTGLIRNAVNPDMCLHKKDGGWNDGNPVHLWNCEAGGPEMKTWRLDNGLIRNAVNPQQCIHKRSPDWANGNLVHLWRCDAGLAESKTWRADPYFDRVTSPDPVGSAESFGYGVMKLDRAEPLLVILASFTDAPFRPPLTRAFFDSIFFGVGAPGGGDAGTAVGYFRENSYGRLTLQRAGLVSVQFPTTRNCVMGVNCPGSTSNGFQYRAQAIALAAQQGGFRFDRFDRNADGRVMPDELAIVEIAASATPTTGGQRGPMVPPCVRVTNGARPVSVCGLMTSFNPNASFNTMLHETAHSWGAHDLYGPRAALNFGLTLMANTRRTGARFHFDPWHKMAFGWLRPRVFNMNGPGTCVSIAAAQTSGFGQDDTSSAATTPILLFDPARSAAEYFMIEFRTRALGGADIGVVDTLGGLAIWRVQPKADLNISDGMDETVGDTILNFGRVNHLGAPSLTRGGASLWRASHGDIRLAWADGSDAGLTIRVGPMSPTPSGIQVEFFRTPLTGPFEDHRTAACFGTVDSAHR